MNTKAVELKSSFLDVGVAHLGAEMQYFRTSNGDDLLWNGDASYWTGRAPILFPIVGRAVNDEIKTGHHFAKMNKHGFARRSEFQLQTHTESMCQHKLQANDQSRALYPFDFSLTVTHSLDNATLTCTVDIKNDSHEPMPFGFGFHPAFRWPLPKAERKAHFVALENAGAPKRRKLQGGLLEKELTSSPFLNGVLEIKEEFFVEDALVFPNATSALRYGPKEGPHLTFSFSNLPDFALWKPVNAPFLCIEPWHGTASVIGDGPQIADRPNSISLDPGDTTSFSYSVTFTA